MIELSGAVYLCQYHKILKYFETVSTNIILAEDGGMSHVRAWPRLFTRKLTHSFNSTILF